MFATFGPMRGMDADDWVQEAAVTVLGVLADGYEQEGGHGLIYYLTRLRLLRCVVERSNAIRRREPTRKPLDSVARDFHDSGAMAQGIERDILRRERMALVRVCLAEATPKQRRAVARSLAGVVMEHHETLAKWRFCDGARERLRGAA